MIRSDLKKRLSTLRFNWLEAVSFLVVAGLGLALAHKGYVMGGWITTALGVILAAVAIGYLLLLLRLAGTHRETAAFGVVEITERRIAYLAPTNGVVVDLDDVSRIDIVTTDGGPFASDVFWVFDIDGQSPVQIPASAKDAGDIINVVDGLPGASMTAVIAAMSSTDDAVFEIWKAKPRQA